MVGLPQGMTSFAMGSILYIPNIVWLIAIVYIIGHVALQKTTAGRKVCAVGDNSESARLSGINVKRVTLAAFVLSGFCAALSGIVYMGRLNSGQPIAGQSYEMYAIAAAVIGGASLTKGGIGSMYPDWSHLYLRTPEWAYHPECKHILAAGVHGRGPSAGSGS